MEFNRPGFEDIERAFASTRLEPEVSEALLETYAAGRATEAEREIVETMMEVDPAVSETVAALREELSRIHEPLPSVEVRPPSEPRRTLWTNRPLPLCLGAAAVVCAVLLVIKQRQVGEQASLLARTKQQVGALQARLNVESVVARALSRGLQVPAFIGDVGATRGEVQLDLKMSPNQTVIAQPVHLTWSGTDAAKGTAVDIEASSMGTSIWHGHSSQQQIDVPSSLLKANTTYSWRVVRGSKTSDWASFRVCTDAEAKRAAQIAGNPQLGPLERGILYAQLGFVSDASREFQLLKKTEPALADRLNRELPFGSP